MVPKINARGTSFKGAAAYLLHDKGQAATAGRVAWVETVNLATANPQTAWRVMAATAMDAGRLKELAGVKKSGRTSKDAVMHVTLSWSPDQRPDRKEMATFARRALNALKAGDRQAMIICHKDEEHPHVHLLINRVSPADGRMLPSAKEKLALSKLALSYEKEGGKIYCEEREANARRREQGEFVRGEKDIPQTEYEALQGALEDAETLIPAALLSEKLEAVVKLRASMKAKLRARLAEVRGAMRPAWAALYRRQRGEVRAGRQEKDSTLQRLTAWVAGQAGPGGTSLPFLRQNLKGLPAHQRGRQRRQEAERGSVRGAQRLEIGNAIREIKQLYARALELIPFRRTGRDAPAKEAPAAAGRILTPIQRRAVELSEAVRKAEPSPRTAARPLKDREFEP